MFGRKGREKLQEQQRLADEAVTLSAVRYMEAITLDREAERVQRGHRRLHRENHFAEKMFGAVPR